MIGMVQHDDIVMIRKHAGHSKRQIIGFASGIYEKADFQRFWQRRSQTLRKAHNVLVQVPRVCVEQIHLIVGGLNHFGAAVSDVANIVDTIEVRDVGLVVQILTMASHNVQ